jgi:cobalt/nickel transport protein
MVDKKSIILLFLVVFILAVPITLYNGRGVDQGYFVGTDDQGSKVIEETGYKPWIHPIWQPPSGEIESLLFAMQAAIGAVIIGYIFRYYIGQAKERAKKDKK